MARPIGQNPARSARVQTAQRHIVPAVADRAAPAPIDRPPLAAPVEPEAPAEGFTAVLLARHGARPLAFEGRLLAEAGNRTTGMPVLSEIALYETRKAGFVVAITHVLAELGGPDLCFAETCADAEAVRGVLFAHDPLAEMPLAAFATELDTAEGELALAWSQGMQRQRHAWTSLLSVLLGPVTA